MSPLRRYRSDLAGHTRCAVDVTHHEVHGCPLAVQRLRLRPGQAPMAVDNGWGPEVLVDDGCTLVQWFFPGRHYSVKATHNAAGQPVQWYTDFCTPPEWAGDHWEHTDLKLDYAVWPDGRRKLLDEDEFAAAVAAGEIDPGLAAAVRRALAEVLAAEWPPPFIRAYRPLGPFRTLLLDLDGTLYFRGEPVPGAAAALAALRRRGFCLRFLTNTDSLSPAAVAARARQYGLDVRDQEVFSPVAAALRWLADRPGATVHALVTPAVAPLLAPYAPPPGGCPDAVVVGDCREVLSYGALNAACRHLLAGARLLALQRGRLFWDAGGPNLDTGAIVAALEYASGQAAQVLGKPDPGFFRLALADAGCPPALALVVGDDPATDLAGARAAGIAAVLVRTGKFTAAALAAAPTPPDHVLDSIAALPAYLT